MATANTGKNVSLNLWHISAIVPADVSGIFTAITPLSQCQSRFSPLEKSFVQCMDTINVLRLIEKLNISNLFSHLSMNRYGSTTLHFTNRTVSKSSFAYCLQKGHCCLFTASSCSFLS